MTVRGYAVSAVDGSPIYYEVASPATPVIEGRSPAHQRHSLATDLSLPARKLAADAIVLCDGIGCDGYVWRYLLRELSGRAPVIHWHYRGHGRTPLPRRPERVSIADLADDLIAVLADAELERGVIFGHSLGVQVALETYRRHPTRVAGLVLVCGAAGHPLRTFKGSNILERSLPAIRAIVDRAPNLIGKLTRKLVPTRLTYLAATLLEANDDLLEQADLMPYLRGLSRVDPQLFVTMLESAAAHSAHQVLETIAVPTLVIAASRDGFTPPQLSRAMHRAIPDAELVMVRDGSHTVPIERPGFVNRAVADFLARRLAG